MKKFLQSDLLPIIYNIVQLGAYLEHSATGVDEDGQPNL
jgi:hypothetical protein